MTIGVRNKMIIHSAVYIAALVALALFVIVPAVSKSRMMSQEIHKQEIYLEKLYQRGQLLKKVKRQLAEVRPLIEQLSQGFVNPDQSVKFISSLEKIAQDNELVQKIEVGTEEKIRADNYEVLPVRLILKGNFVDLVKYLRQLEQMEYYFNINSLSVVHPAMKSRASAASLSDRQAKIDVLIMARSYWSK